MTDPKNILGQSIEEGALEGEKTTPSEFLNPKFKSIEEQAKGYNEAERAMTEANKEAARLQERLDTIEQNKANIEAGEKIIQSQGKNQPTPDFWNRWITDPEGIIEERARKIAQETVAPIMQSQRRSEVRAEIEDLARNTPDLKEIYPAALQMLKENPALANIPNALTIAVGMVKKDQYEKTIAEQSAERQKREAKGELSGSQIAQHSEIMGEGEAGKGSPDQDKTIEDRIGDRIVKSGLGKNPALF